MDLSARPPQEESTRAQWVLPASASSVVGVAVAQFAAFWLTHWFFRGNDAMLPLVWMPVGVALSALLLASEAAFLPLAAALALGGIVADVLGGQTTGVALLGAVSTVGGGALGAWMVRRLAGRAVTFNTFRETRALVAMAALVSVIVSSLGAVLLVQQTQGALWTTWLTWWMSDLLGLLLLPPLLVGAARRPLARADQTLWYPLEWAAFVIIGYVLSQMVMTQARALLAPRPYMLIAVVAWGALRYGTRSVALAIFLFSLQASQVIGVEGGTLAFPGATITERLMGAQIFLAFACSTALLLASARADGRTATHAREREWARFTAEKKEDIRRLEELTALLSKAQAMAHVGHWSWTLATDRLEMSDELLRMHGLTREEFNESPLSLTNRVQFDDRERTMQVRAAALRGETTEPLTYRVIWPDASLHYVRAEPHEVLRDADGRPRAYFGTSQDITDQVLAREAIDLSESRYRSLFEGHHTPMFVVSTMDLRIIDANPAAAAFYGYSRDVLRTMDVAMLAAAPVERVRERLRTTLQGANHTFVGAHRLANGESRMVEIDASVIQSEGTPLILAICHDISEQVRNEEAKAASERKFARLFESQQVGIILTDPKGKVLEANPAAARLMGVTSEYLRDSSINSPSNVEVVDLDERVLSTGEFPIVRVLRTGVPVHNQEVGLSRDGGPRRWLMFSVSPLDLPGHGVMVEMVDVTERHNAERLVAEQRARLHAILNVTTDGLHIVDREGHVLECNEAFLKSLGMTALPTDRRLHLNDWDAQVAPDETPAWLDTLSTGPRTFESMHRRVDGSVFPVEVSVVHLELQGQRLFVASSRDISLRRQKEDEARAFTETLEARVASEVAQNLEKERLLIHQSRLAAMGEMISAIAHQWRQPLNALAMVLNNLDDVSATGDLTPDRVSDATRLSRRLVEQMSTTISDFRDFFRPDKQAVPFRLGEEVRAALDLMDASFSHHGIHVDFAAESVAVRGFPNEFAQVVLNLLANARDAIVEAGKPDGAVTIRVERHGRDAIVRVRDSGKGISDDVIDRIFEPYWTTKPSGTGLGLYMSRLIVQRSLHGTLTAHNAPDGGAEFIMTLAVASDADDA